MATTTRAPRAERTEQPGSVDPVAAAEQTLRDRRGRLAALKAEIHELDAQEQAFAEAAAAAIAAGERATATELERFKIRAQIEDLHRALPKVEELVYAAEADLRRAREAVALRAYRAARVVEEQAAGGAAVAVRAAAAALKALHEAGREAYAQGLAAGAEGPTHYRRRLGARAAWLGTEIGFALPEARTKNADLVTDLASRLRQLLPMPPKEGDADGE